MPTTSCRFYNARGGKASTIRSAKRGPGSLPNAERARHNRARNAVASRRQKSFLQRAEQNVETTRQIVEKRSKLGEPDSSEYLARQSTHSQFITVFGRKTVREALRDPNIKFRHIHMDEKLIAVNSNVKRSDADPVILEILDLIRERDVTLIPSDRMRISFISKSAKQDGGIVADLFAPPGSKFSNVEDFIHARQSSQQSHSNRSDMATSENGYTILALDQITTPANMGMIIRSAVASGSFDALLVGPGSASVTNPMVIKSSASTVLLPAQNNISDAESKKKDGRLSTVFITAKESMFQALTELKKDGAEIILLAARPHLPGTKSTSKGPKSLYVHDVTQVSLWDLKVPSKCVFVIGGESSGHDPAVEQMATIRAHIPMIPGVESLNCAVTASLVSFAPQLRKPGL